MKALEGKVAVITGGTRGLGLGIARAFVEAGARVVVGSRSKESVDRAIAELGGAEVADGTACNVGSRQEVRALAERAINRFGRIDVWVNNAGLSAPYGPTTDIPDEQFQAVLQTNILGTYNGSRAAIAQFLSQGGGKLINLLGRGDTEPVPFQNAYASSKTWVRAFTRALASEYRARNIGIFALNPGLVFTDMISKVDAIAGYEERLRPFETIARMWGNPPDVPAKKAVWLASPATDRKTGIEVKVLTFSVITRGALRELFRRIGARLSRKLRERSDPHGHTLTVNTVEPALDRALPPRDDISDCRRLPPTAAKAGTGDASDTDRHGERGLRPNP